MDFFEYASFAMGFAYDASWVPYLVGGLCFAVVFVFSAAALYTIAAREGYANKWMAFVPVFNTYYIGVCGQKNSVLNMKAKTVALVTAILELILIAGNIVYFTAYESINSFGFAQEYYTTIGDIDLFINVVPHYLPQELNWAAWVYDNLNMYILNWLQLIYLFFEIMTLTVFFQTFAARRYLIFTITSVLLPIQGILFFILRNNAGMNYRDFIRREQERQYRMYQQYNRQNFNPYDNSSYSNNYNNHQNNPYSDSGYKDGSAADDPFSEFGGSGDSNGSGGGNSDDDPFNIN